MEVIQFLRPSHQRVAAVDELTVPVDQAARVVGLFGREARRLLEPLARAMLVARVQAARELPAVAVVAVRLP